jgi:hypothetical protein
VRVQYTARRQVFERKTSGKTTTSPPYQISFGFSQEVFLTSSNTSTHSLPNNHTRQTPRVYSTTRTRTHHLLVTQPLTPSPKAEVSMRNTQPRPHKGRARFTPQPSPSYVSRAIVGTKRIAGLRSRDQDGRGDSARIERRLRYVLGSTVGETCLKILGALVRLLFDVRVGIEHLQCRDRLATRSRLRYPLLRVRGKESQYQSLEGGVVLIVRSLRYHNHIAAVT